MYQTTLTINTQKKVVFYDLTKHIKKLIEKNKVKNGIILVRTRHTTTAIMTNENELGLIKDAVKTLNLLIRENKYYQHDDFEIRAVLPDEPQNATAHLRAMMLGSEVHVPIVDGAALLGRWQSVLFVELDGPRKKRTIDIIIFNEELYEAS